MRACIFALGRTLKSEHKSLKIDRAAYEVLEELLVDLERAFVLGQIAHVMGLRKEARAVLAGFKYARCGAAAHFATAAEDSLEWLR